MLSEGEDALPTAGKMPALRFFIASLTNSAHFRLSCVHDHLLEVTACVFLPDYA